MFIPGEDSVLISKEVWWSEPPNPEKGETVDDVTWGYLEFYRTPTGIDQYFNPEQPTKTEIINRKSCR